MNLAAAKIQYKLPTGERVQIRLKDLREVRTEIESLDASGMEGFNFIPTGIISITLVGVLESEKVLGAK